MTDSAHFHGIAAADEPTPAVLRPGFLNGVGITVVGGADAAKARAAELGATEGHDVLVFAAPDDEARGHVLDAAWEAIRTCSRAAAPAA